MNDQATVWRWDRQMDTAVSFVGVQNRDTPYTQRRTGEIAGLREELRRCQYALLEVFEGLFRHNMGDYESCAKAAAGSALRVLDDDWEKRRDRILGKEER